MLVLRDDQGVRIGTDALADIAEGRSRNPPAGNPEIRGGRSSPALDERLGKPDLSVQFECARCTATARDVNDGAGSVSMILTRTPSLASHKASTKPVGPAPTIRTSVSQVEGAVISRSYAIVRGRIGITRQPTYATNVAIRSTLNVFADRSATDK